ncbi:MAG: hypothetical protein R3B53_02530 [Candidatus Paceibacterota bacterium]
MNEKTPGNEVMDNSLDELKVVGLSLLLDLNNISREVKMHINNIFDKQHSQKHFLIGQLIDYLENKNRNILKADDLIKQGHELEKSVLIGELGLTSEDRELLEWFRQIRQ